MGAIVIRSTDAQSHDSEVTPRGLFEPMGALENYRAQGFKPVFRTKPLDDALSCSTTKIGAEGGTNPVGEFLAVVERHIEPRIANDLREGSSSGHHGNTPTCHGFN